MAARKKKAKAAPARKQVRKSVRRKAGKRRSKRAARRKYAYNEKGIYFGGSFRDVQLQQADEIRKKLIAVGVEIPTEWDDIRLFYATHPEFSTFRCAAICRRDWRQFWTHHKDGNWVADREEYEARLKRETLGMIAKKSAKGLAAEYESFAAELATVARSILRRTDHDLNAEEPEQFETVASQKNEDGVLSQVKRRIPRPSAQHMIAILDKYTETMRVLLGLPGVRGVNMATSRRDGPGGVPGEHGTPDEPKDQARRAWEAQNAMWRTELGHDFVEPDTSEGDGPPTEDPA